MSLNSSLSLRAEVRALLTRLARGSAPPSDDADVFAIGLVRSLNLIELITQLEDSYGVQIDQRTLQDGHLRSVARIVTWLGARASAASAGVGGGA